MDNDLFKMTFCSMVSSLQGNKLWSPPSTPCPQLLITAGMKPWQETWLLKFLVLSHLLDLTPDPDARFFFILTLSLESIKVEAAHILMRLRCQVFFFLSSLPPRYFKPLVRKHRHTKPHPGSTSGSDLLPPRPPLTFQTSQDCILMVWTVEADQRTHAHTGLRSGSSILSGENLFSSLLCNWVFFLPLE